MKIIEYNECDFLFNLKEILYRNEISFIFCNEKKNDLIYFLSDFCDLNCEINSEKIVQIFEKIDYPNLLKQIIIFLENDFSLKFFSEIINCFDNNFTNIFHNFAQKNYFDYDKNIKQILEIKKIPNELKNILEKILQIFENFFLFLKEKNFFLDEKEIKKNDKITEENFENFISSK